MKAIGKFLLVLFFLMVVPVCFVSAEEEKQQSQVFDLGDVVVRGQSETISKVGTVDTVDYEMIDLTNSRNLSDALNTLPGVSISSGGPKAESSISVRGLDRKSVV